MGCGECANEETGFIAFTLVVDAEVVHLMLCKEVAEPIQGCFAFAAHDSAVEQKIHLIAQKAPQFLTAPLLEGGNNSLRHILCQQRSTPDKEEREEQQHSFLHHNKYLFVAKVMINWE